MENLPLGTYQIAGPFNYKKAVFLQKAYRFLPHMARSFVYHRAAQPKLPQTPPQGIWRPYRSETGVYPNDIIKPGISRIRWRCVRCGSGNIDTHQCPECGKTNCLVCRDCYMLGPIRGCRLYLWQSPGVPEYFARELKPQIPFDLTPGQKSAGDALRQALAKGSRKLLLHAACGAGKTEVASLLIADALNCGKRVLYTVPRRDVAREVGERLREYFPEVDCVILYGKSPEKYTDQRLVAATTHQVIRFYKSFDLAIIDEGDAFPYKGNDLLVRAVKRASRGPIVYMTATPTDEMLKEFKKSEVVFIPARHHKRALPVPRFSSASLEKALEGVKPPLLVFVPYKKNVSAMVERIKRCKPDWKVFGISSETENRDQLIQWLKDGTTDVLVSTSVLERGITVSGVTVIVHNANCDIIYTREVLVQIAGRAGRTVACPTGDVVFLAKKPNKPMKDAKAEIIALNEMARERGEILC